VTSRADAGQDEQDRLQHERRQQAVSRYLIPVLHFLEDFRGAEGLDCGPYGPQCYWIGPEHHWSLVYDVDDEERLLAYVDITLDMADMQSMRLRITTSNEISEGNAAQLAALLSSATGIPVAQVPSDAENDPSKASS
jgi:hypothetical protein